MWKDAIIKMMKIQTKKNKRYTNEFNFTMG